MRNKIELFNEQMSANNVEMANLTEGIQALEEKLELCKGEVDRCEREKGKLDKVVEDEAED